MEDRMIPNVDRLEQAALPIIRKIGSELSRVCDLELTGPQYGLINMIDLDGPCMATKLAEKLDVKPSAITVMIDRLVGRGYVVRQNDDKDRRVIFVQLTEEGKKALYHVHEARSQIIGRYLAGLEQQEMDTLLDIVEKLAGLIVKEQ